MKVFIFLLALVSAATAQTNLGTITFTNRAGRAYTNAQITSISSSKIVFRVPSGGAGQIRLAELPPALQDRFGYDPDKAGPEEVALQKKEVAITALTRSERKKSVQRKADYDDLVARIKERDDLLNSSVPIDGTLVSKHADGTLIINVRFTDLVAVADFPKPDSVHVGERLKLPGWRDGDYSYNSIAGERMKLLKFRVQLPSRLRNLPENAPSFKP